MKPTITVLRRLARLETRSARTATRDEIRDVVEAMRRTVPVNADDEPLSPAELRLLTPRWRPQRHHPGQAAAFHSTARFRAIECGRRSGKSEGRKREAVVRALDPNWPLDDRYIVIGAPTQQQAMRLYWRDLLRLVPRALVHAVRKSEFEIELINGSVLRVLGMDRPERAEGEPIDDLFLDEFADLRPDVLDHLRPALDTTDRPPGSLTAFGTTDMRSGDAFIQLCDQWQGEADRGDRNYGYFRWTSAGIVSASAWNEAQRTLDPALFAVEYEARRVSTGNRAFYCFDRELHLSRDLKLLTEKPLIVALDFNCDPGVAVFAQEQSIDHYDTSARLPEKIADDFTAVLGEVFIRRSNTPTVMRSVMAWIEAHRHTGPVRVYGDPAGGAQGSAKVEGSDIDLIRKVLRPKLGDRMSLHFPRKAPAVVARLNAMNARLLAADGFVRCVLDPDAAPELIKDLELVHLKDGAHHIELDKPTSGPGKLRTHLADAISYAVAEMHPIRTRGRLVDVDV